LFRDQEGWIGAYKARNAYWLHDGNPNRPHAELTSGNHSNGFFNSRLVIPDDSLMSQAASDLLDRLELDPMGYVEKTQTFVGPQTGATKLAELLRDCAQLNDRITREWASPAKDEVDGQKAMVFQEDDRKKLLGKQIILCEDVITTGGTTELMADEVRKAGGLILPVILTLVNRSGQHKIGGKLIVALIHQTMPIWAPDECPLCAQGSEAIRPKGENWARLNANYE